MPSTQHPQEYLVTRMDLDARGVALDAHGHPVVIAGALPGERVRARVAKRGTSYDRAQLLAIVQPSAQRAVPACAYFGVCGGCNMQHLDARAQVAVKQRVLEDLLHTHADVRPDRILPALHGPAWAYRHRARLSVRLVAKKGGVLVGFRERNGSYVADMQSCRILPPQISALLLPLRRLLESLSNPHRIPQIEVAVGEDASVLVLRHIEALTADDTARLRAFGIEHGVVWWLQPKGPDTAHPLDASGADVLSYRLPAYGVCLPFKPTDFTQVNPAINRSLVQRALSLLDVQPDERVADLFCGLGNFSLPLARIARAVVGLEGNAALIERATMAAQAHGLQDKTQFHVCDLFTIDADWLENLGDVHKMLIDPPREGAEALCLALAALAPQQRPERIVYVSCNPVTLARDTAILVHRAHYRLQAAGVVNMFPHTGHVESMAVFTRL